MKLVDGLQEALRTQSRYEILIEFLVAVFVVWLALLAFW